LLSVELLLNLMEVRMGFDHKDKVSAKITHKDIVKADDKFDKAIDRTDINWDKIVKDVDKTFNTFIAN